jgi:glycosyltransferase involved in cell wall biosynthesis
MVGVLGLKMMTVSIVIPTRNRDEDLKELLASIRKQTILPIEVIVVDDSDNLRTRNLVEEQNKVFPHQGILLKYLRGNEQNRSISAARNLGAKESTGEVTFFIDDDVILDNRYIEKILEVYNEYPDALGVQGDMARPAARRGSVLGNALNKVLFQVHYEKNSCRVHAAGMSFPIPLTRIIRSQWLTGTQSSYKKEVLKDFKWDNNLKGYSLCEDMDISYRIQKCHPDSLYSTPHARVLHKFSPVARIDTRELIYFGVAYPTYIFFKDMKQTPLNMMVFVWGIFFGKFVSVLLEKDHRSVLFLMGAHLSLLRNLECIKKGNFAFLQTTAKKRAHSGL